MAKRKYVYFFGGGKAEGSAGMKNLLGGKGANLAEMTNLDIPVPPGFTITTAACIEYQKIGDFPEGLMDEVEDNLKILEKVKGASFGDPQNPLLVSVRSGAPVSMPGMMDTVLNIGLNDDTVKGISAKFGDERFPLDSYRRLIEMFGDVVSKVERSLFQEALNEVKKEKRVKQDTELGTSDLKQLVDRYKEIYRREKGEDFPRDPREQLIRAIKAVFGSWDNPRAVKYRQLNNIPDDLGTAVNVQAMVFGNLDEGSATGVAFTRNPGNGELQFFGEFLPNAQGEDVVAGIRTPYPINNEQKGESTLPSLEEMMPEIYRELVGVYKKLEHHYRDMQDIEFTIEDGKLYLLQTRTGKRTAQAAVRMAVDMVKEGLIDKETALMRVTPVQINQLLHPMIDPTKKYEVIAKGLPASPGAAVGKVVFNAENAEERAESGEQVILVRPETSPEDIAGMSAAKGILTATGGMTSHAAVVARGMGKPCVAGCGALVIDEENKMLRVGSLTIREKDYLTINGNTGEVILGEVPLVQPELGDEFAEFLSWADEVRRLGVQTNADTPNDAQVARDFGAEGIGLCRTEHMFFGEDRILAVRKMILADNPEERRKAINKIRPMQRGDFIGIFRVMDGLPVTIRLLDPPLHEFLPSDDEEIKKLASQMGVSYDKLKQTVNSLKEFNPMLGHRGCRLGISNPEIYEMQVEAIFEAAVEGIKQGIKVIPEVMIPLVGHIKEFSILKEMVERKAEEVFERAGVSCEYKVGTMIEVPRASVTADEIAKEAEFFSFGTNDLTQMGFGLSRDDGGNFLPRYVEIGILQDDPFQSLDIDGVGKLVEIGVKLGRSTRADLKIGICGEHGGEPKSIEFFHKCGLNYVSCSPYRVPIARLAAAQAVIKEKKGKE
jgi:pyruvate,orthophosphate dikinase